LPNILAPPAVLPLVEVELAGVELVDVEAEVEVVAEPVVVV
jgi:hypothetical protein